jgi:hypothetical protein
MYIAGVSHSKQGRARQGKEKKKEKEGRSGLLKCQEQLGSKKTD